MEIHGIIGFLDVNIYFLVNRETHGAIIIDCGVNAEQVNQKAKELGVTIKALLLTHAHFDHAGCGAQLQNQGVKVFVSQLDSLKLNNKDNLAEDFGVKFTPFTPDGILTDGQTLEIEGFSIKVIHTPGHTDGSLTFLVEDVLFTGDTLFNSSIGRTDLPTGNYAQLRKSVLALYNLPENYKVYPGHGDFTTLNRERKYNQFVRL